MTELHPASLAKLVRSLALLALPFDAQVGWLRSLGLGEPEFADELALELEDGAQLSLQFQEAGWLKPEARTLILEMDAMLAERSGPEHEDFWRVETVRDAPEWDQVRRLATQALLAV